MFVHLSRTIVKRKNLWSKENISSGQKVFNQWEKIILEVFGPKIITLVKPYIFKNDKLIIIARNSTVACEIQNKKERIRATMNKNLENLKVKDIILKIG